MNRRTFLKSSGLLLASAACDSPIRPSTIVPDETGKFSDPNLAKDVKDNWSPYINVQSTGEALDAYRDSLSLLLQKEQLDGVRVGIDRGGEGLNNPVIRMIDSLGIEMLGLIDNLYLFEPNNIEQWIDRIFSAYPEIRYFQVGNEITTIPPRTMPIEQYMAVLNRIYHHVQTLHPGRAILVTQSFLGDGLRGPTELQTAKNLGLTLLDPDKIIIAINSYNPENVSQYVGILESMTYTDANKKPKKYRVWVTESGINNPDSHISFVKDRYHFLKDYLRAERVYWYVLWAGDPDGSPDSHAGFSLTRNPGSYPNYWKSPLFKILTETN